VPVEEGSPKEVDGQGGIDASMDCKLKRDDAARATMKKESTYVHMEI
jgi:hypothetical protein